MLQRALLVLAVCAASLLTSSDVRAGAVVHVKLVAAPGGMFLVGRPPHLDFEPARVTMSLRHHGMVHAHVLGAGPHGVLFAGAKLRPLKWHLKGRGGDLKVGPGGIKIKPPHGRGHGGGHIKLKF
jgi:hypothetical protein